MLLLAIVLHEQGVYLVAELRKATDKQAKCANPTSLIKRPGYLWTYKKNFQMPAKWPMALL